MANLIPMISNFVPFMFIPTPTDMRRDQTDLRCKEVLAATMAVHSLNEHNIPELERMGLSFVGRLQTSEQSFMGHSFGGATAVAAALRRPDLSTTVIAHEPALDWAPNDVRRALFPQGLINKIPLSKIEGGMGGWGDGKNKLTKATIKDLRALFLFSEEWYHKVRLVMLLLLLLLVLRLLVLVLPIGSRITAYTLAQCVLQRWALQRCVLLSDESCKTIFVAMPFNYSVHSHIRSFSCGLYRNGPGVVIWSGCTETFHRSMGSIASSRVLITTSFLICACSHRFG